MPHIERVQRVTILNGAAITTEVIDMTGVDRAIIIMPAAWTAAALSFAVRPELAAAEAPVYDSSGTEVSIASAAAAVGRAVLLDSVTLQQMTQVAPFMRIRSGLVGA